MQFYSKSYIIIINKDPITIFPMHTLLLRTLILIALSEEYIEGFIYSTKHAFFQ